MSVQISLPHAGIVLLVGPSNSGKTTLLNSLVEQGILQRSEIVSSDQFRLLVSDLDFIDLGKHTKDEQAVVYAKYQQISEKAFAAMGQLINIRSALGKLTVVDATHLWPDDRKTSIDLAHKNHVSATAIVLDLPEKLLLERDARRELPRGRNRIKQQVRAFRNNLRSINTEGYSKAYFLNEVELEQCTFVRLSNPLVKEVGVGLDFIGDIHGCYDEFLELLDKLGFRPEPAIKVRGRKYLHIIYGIDYLQPKNLTRLKQRTVGRKQRKALMELALGIEGVKRFVNKEPLARVHECVLATLALEAEPVDPRL